MSCCHDSSGSDGGSVVLTIAWVSLLMVVIRMVIVTMAGNDVGGSGGRSGLWEVG